MSSSDDLSSYYDKVNSSKFPSLLGDMNDDAADALAQASTQLNDKDVMPDDFVKKYQKDRQELSNAKGAFGQQFQEGGDPPKALMAAFNDYCSSLQDLQMDNARADDLLEIGKKFDAVQQTKVSVELAKLGRSQILDGLRKQLKELRDELKDKLNEREMFPLKQILKTMVEVCAAALVVVDAAPAALIAVGALTADVAIDYIHGDKAADTAADSVPDVIETIEKVGEQRQNLLEEAGKEAKSFASSAAKVIGKINDAETVALLNQRIDGLQVMIADTEAFRCLQGQNGSALRRAARLAEGPRTQSGLHQEDHKQEVRPTSEEIQDCAGPVETVSMATLLRT
jgi:hypothetical protein